LEWNEGWEADKLRESLATAALDLELAETRCLQLQQSLDSTRTNLTAVANERDTLFEENIDMRRRISNIQTTLAKGQLEKYQRAVSTGKTRVGCLFFSLEHIQCQLPASSENVCLFLTIDGLEGFETIITGNFYTAEATLGFTVGYEGLDVDEATYVAIQRTTFVFQLHQSSGTSSAVRAMASMSGTEIAQSRLSLASLDRVLTLFDGDGQVVGKMKLVVMTENLYLPVLLDREAHTQLLSNEQLRAALVSLRQVIGIRVQVYSCSALRDSPVPSPYVFYTATPVGGTQYITDTVVNPISGAPTSSPTFQHVPIEHRVNVNSDLLHFISESILTFVVFDRNATDVSENLGLVSVPLRELLQGPSAVIQRREKLSSKGEIEFGISWMRIS
jgi:hypothetical protein